MDKLQAEMLQAEFEELSKKYFMIKSYGYFVDGNEKGMLSFNNINDNELMFMISQLVIRLAAKNETTPDDILMALSEGIRKQFPEQEEVMQN